MRIEEEICNENALLPSGKNQKRNAFIVKKYTVPHEIVTIKFGTP